jgi:pre-mRNA-processing factor 6
MFEPRQARKTRSVDALKKTSDHPLVICTVARLFWIEGRVEKARDWFKRAVATNGDLGDCWGWWYRFEMEHGTKVHFAVPSIFGNPSHSILQEHQQAVIDGCNSQEPRHGATWQSVSKDVANMNKKTAEILETVAKKLK